MVRGGESYLDVTSVVVVEEGRRLEEGPDSLVFVGGVVLLIVALVMWQQHRLRAAAPWESAD